MNDFSVYTDEQLKEIARLNEIQVGRKGRATLEAELNEIEDIKLLDDTEVVEDGEIVKEMPYKPKEGEENLYFFIYYNGHKFDPATGKETGLKDNVINCIEKNVKSMVANATLTFIKECIYSPKGFEDMEKINKELTK